MIHSQHALTQRGWHSRGVLVDEQSIVGSFDPKSSGPSSRRSHETFYIQKIAVGYVLHFLIVDTYRKIFFPGKVRTNTTRTSEPRILCVDDGTTEGLTLQTYLFMPGQLG